MSLAEQVIHACRDKGLMLSMAESCTGGLLAAALTEVPGASAVVERGFVTYTNAAKEQMLGVSADTLRLYGAVSPQVAQEMAQGALARSQADLAVAITGIAGPGGSEFKPEGRVCFALAQTDQPTRCETIEFGALGRANVRQASCQHALEQILSAIHGMHKI